jgi:hypothetical protein
VPPADQFADALDGIVDAEDRLRRWHIAIVRFNIDRLKMSSATREVDLRRFVTRAAAARLSKPAAFSDICKQWTAV